LEARLGGHGARIQNLEEADQSLSSAIAAVSSTVDGNSAAIDDLNPYDVVGCASLVPKLTGATASTITLIWDATDSYFRNCEPVSPSGDAFTNLSYTGSVTPDAIFVDGIIRVISVGPLWTGVEEASISVKLDAADTTQLGKSGDVVVRPSDATSALSVSLPVYLQGNYDPEVYLEAAQGAIYGGVGGWTDTLRFGEGVATRWLNVSLKYIKYRT
jgi:hypothetical protein